ncbi:MAG: hypothetical protein H7Z14_19760 [Anaerolineae bacterium]|nr:hypothetical protein [Phycisphaerae bacterium]
MPIAQLREVKDYRTQRFGASGVFMRFPGLELLTREPIEMRDPVRMKRIAGRIFFAVVTIAASSCTAPRGPLVVSDPDPSIKIPAIKVAVADRDLSSVRQMVKDLESDDAAVRFYSIGGLRRLTGENFGYLYYEETEERRPATKRWQAWLTQVEQSATRDGPDASTDALSTPATQP